MTEFTLDTEHPITVTCDHVQLDGLLHIPVGVTGIVLFAHGSGSGHLSPRNQYVASVLQKQKIATLLFDLLTRDEEKQDIITSQYRFDIDFLANRLDAATEWVLKNPVLNKLPLGYFGASTGAAAALVVAARHADRVNAVVSRGGRPDMAGESLAYVEAPTLMIVGSLDTQVIKLNEDAMANMHCEKKLAIVKGATHLFEEPGTLEQVATLATTWFENKL